MDAGAVNPPVSRFGILLARRNEIRGRHLEPPEFESGRHGATDQRPVTGGLRALPGIRRHDRLRPLAGREIGTERHQMRCAAVMGDLQHQRTAGIVMPDLDGIDAMPVRTIAAREQEIDRGRISPAAVLCVPARRRRPSASTPSVLRGAPQARPARAAFPDASRPPPRKSRASPTPPRRRRGSAPAPCASASRPRCLSACRRRRI